MDFKMKSYTNEQFKLYFISFCHPEPLSASLSLSAGPSMLPQTFCVESAKGTFVVNTPQQQ